VSESRVHRVDASGAATRLDGVPVVDLVSSAIPDRANATDSTRFGPRNVNRYRSAPRPGGATGSWDGNLHALALKVARGERAPWRTAL
jgi:hypothetical protein